MLPFIVKLLEEIIKEIEIWKIECDKIKNSPLGYLKKHENAGAETNNFQTSVPKNLIESSYWLPFTLRNCAKLFGGTHRNYFLKEWNKRRKKKKSSQTLLPKHPGKQQPGIKKQNL